jgi:hypothetical protein
MSLRAPLGVTGVETADEAAALNGDSAVETRTEPPLEPAPPRRRGALASLLDRGALDSAGGSTRPDELRAEQIAPAEVGSRACSTCGRPIPIDRLLAIPDATQCLDCKRGEAIPPEGDALVAVAAQPPVEAAETRTEAEADVEVPVSVLAPPEPAAEAPVEIAPEPIPAPIASPPTPSPALGPHAWNVWELERLARERAGGDPARDEEWQFLLVYLREFADPSGNLPTDFDGLVRESFSELLG